MRLQRLIEILSYVAVFFLFFLPAIDTDLGWHLRYGEHFIKTGHFLRENTLTYYLADYKWANSYTFYQILTTLIYNSGGLLGLAFAYGILGLACFWFFNRLNNVSIVLSLLTFSLLAAFAWNVFDLGWRAQVFTFLFLVLELWIFQKSKKNKKWLWSLPPLFILWANIHGGFVLGLLLLCFETIEQVRHKHWNRVGVFIATIILGLFGTLINPYGVNIWQETLKHSNYPLYSLIAEWVRPEPSVIVIVIVIAGTLATILWKQKNPRRVFYSLVLLLGLALLIQARRNTPIFALFAALPALDLFQKKLHPVEEDKLFPKVSFLFLTIIVCFLGVMQIPRTVRLSTNWNAYCTEGMLKYPCKAISFIRERPIQGTNVYTAYEWGGFLEWQLPQYKYFVDGRMPAWSTKSGKSPYTEYLEIIQAQPSWDKRLAYYKTDWLLIGSGTFLDLELQKGSSGWKERYRDDVAVVYTKL